MDTIEQFRTEAEKVKYQRRHDLYEKLKLSIIDGSVKKKIVNKSSNVFGAFIFQDKK